MRRAPRRFLLVAALAALAAAAPACGPDARDRSELEVAAAASLADALEALRGPLEEAHGVRLVLNLGASGDLARQILAADRADVFLSADVRELDRVDAAGLLAPGTRCELLSNQLAVIVPANDPALDLGTPFDPALLARPEVRHLALADPEAVPAGRYAKTWLEGAGAWSAIADRIAPAVDVRAALAAVAAGACEAGIVYATDAAIDARVRIVHRVPLAEGPPIRYGGAALAGGDVAAARVFLAYLRSAAGSAVFQRFGFLPLAGS